ncbi:putative transposase [Albimonas pacifica]|uniref:Putative transposase n=1 Tax=Albimonas pacifica TaxID=1114924 RepID=A0A1I3BQL2_9RHOB|nr:putative transposase [Albimonas pacifica]
MRPVSFARHRLPPLTIQHAVWLHLRLALSCRDVENLLAERGIAASCETARRWAPTFGAAFAQRIRKRRPRPSGRWRLDEVFLRIRGRIHHLRRAVDDEGEALEALVQSRPDRRAALKLPRKPLKRRGFAPEPIATDRLRSYGAALRDFGLANRHVTGERSNYRAEVPHRPTRKKERQRRGVRSPGSAQRFLSIHAAA